MITEPDIILADEPTGALDSRASGKLLKLFDEVNAEGHQIYRGNQSKDAMYKMISDALTVLQSEGNTGAQAEREAGVLI